MDFLKKIFEIFGYFNKNSGNISKIVEGVKKFQSGISSNVKSSDFTNPMGQLSGSLTVKTQKDVTVDEVRLSFNQYIYTYSHNGAYTWKEHFIGTQKLDGLTLRGGESKVLDFNIEYEVKMTEEEKDEATKKNASIKKLMERPYFRKKGTGTGRDWTFQLVVVYVIAGGEEIKETHVIKVK